MSHPEDTQQLCLVLTYCAKLRDPAYRPGERDHDETMQMKHIDAVHVDMK